MLYPLSYEGGLSSLPPASPIGAVRDNEAVSELLPDRTSDEWDDGDDERDERQRERQLEEERPPHHEPR